MASVTPNQARKRFGSIEEIHGIDTAVAVPRPGSGRGKGEGKTYMGDE